MLRADDFQYPVRLFQFLVRPRAYRIPLRKRRVVPCLYNILGGMLEPKRQVESTVPFHSAHLHFPVQRRNAGVHSAYGFRRIVRRMPHNDKLEIRNANGGYPRII